MYEYSPSSYYVRVLCRATYSTGMYSGTMYLPVLASREGSSPVSLVHRTMYIVHRTYVHRTMYIVHTSSSTMYIVHRTTIALLCTSVHTCTSYSYIPVHAYQQGPLRGPADSTPEVSSPCRLGLALPTSYL